MSNTVNLVTKFLPYVDEQFTVESKKDLVTNQDFSFAGAHTVKVYKISTGSMNDYGRTGPAEGNWSRYGDVEGLDATTEYFTLSKDRSFTFAIDALDQDETVNQLEAAKALARQNREVVIPEVDAYTYGVMATGAGTKPARMDLYASNIYDEITKATEALDNAMVPEARRVLIVTPATYRLLKQSSAVVMETDIGQDMRLKGVIANLDGMSVQKVPANRLPAGFGFLVAHPSATVAPVKLEAFNVHSNPPGISGALVEGRVCYDAFVMDNKAKAIYYQSVYVYTAVAEPALADIGTYYELVNGVYVKTEDVAIDQTKTYYTRA